MTGQSSIDAVLDRIVQLAKITTAKKRAFKDTAFFVLCFAEWSEVGARRNYSPRDRRAMHAIHKAALSLNAALEERTKRVENALLAEWLTRRKAHGAKAAAADF